MTFFDKEWLNFKSSFMRELVIVLILVLGVLVYVAIGNANRTQTILEQVAQANTNLDHALERTQARLNASAQERKILREEFAQVGGRLDSVLDLLQKQRDEQQTPSVNEILKEGVTDPHVDPKK